MSEVNRFLEFFAAAFAGAVVSKMLDIYMETKDVSALNMIASIYATVFLVAGVYVFFVWIPNKKKKLKKGKEIKIK